jgi:carboxyl-terminal processing protease
VSGRILLRGCRVVCVSRFFQRFVFGLSIAICLALVSGFVLGKFGLLGVRAGGQQDGAYRQTNVYREVLEKIQTDYVTEPDINDVTTGALHGLLESLDADSSYLTPAEYKIYKERPAAGPAQVGITASKRFGYAVVVSVLPGSPADKEHLADGDVIESIGDHSTREMSVVAIRMMLEGKAGSALLLSVVRPGKQDPEKVTLTRSVTAVPALTQQQFEGATILRDDTLSEARSADCGARGRDRRRAQIDQLAQGAAGPARLRRGRHRAGAAAGQLVHQTGNAGCAGGAEISPPDICRRSGQVHLRRAAGGAD